VAADFAALTDAYASERADYAALAAQLAAAMQARLPALGIEAIVKWRAKDVRSFVKKALREGYADPLAEITDKAGVRVIVCFDADVPAVEALVGELATILRRESKRDALAYDQLGYLGVHLDVQPSPAILEDADRTRLQDLAAEVQIHTMAQSAWAVVSHDLLYKAPHELSAGILRGITRLVALVELFDAEIARFRAAIEADPDHAPLAALAPLDDEILRFTSRRPDRALSAIVLPPLSRLYDTGPAELYDEVIRPFVEANQFRLTRLFDAYREDERANPLLFQPEALLIFELLQRDPDRLHAGWPVDRLPLELLTSLAEVWGTEL